VYSRRVCTAMDSYIIGAIIQESMAQRMLKVTNPSYHVCF